MIIKPLIKGLSITLKHFLNPFRIVTVQYPDEKLPVNPRYRGRHEHLRDKDDNEKCVACGLCAAACPSDCIRIEGEEDAGVRKARVYEIDIFRCIFCGYCEEACPVEAIHLSSIHDMSTGVLDERVYTKEQLMAPRRGGK